MTLPHDESGSGPAVLLLHNGLCDRRMWDRQLRTFADSRRVIRCDLPGFGDAQLPHGPFSCAEDVLGLLDALDIDRAAIVGNSLGGRVAVDVCVAAPERVSALVLVAPGRAGWDWSDSVREVWRRESEAAEGGDLDRATEISLQLWLDGPHRAPGTVGGELRASVAAMQRRAYELELAAPDAGPERRPSGSSADIRAPALILTGDLDVPDMATIADTYQREIPGARRAVLHGAAHLPSLELPDEFDRLVLDFLREVQGGLAPRRP
jgi:3-oxoadipate enol-lactonase